MPIQTTWLLRISGHPTRVADGQSYRLWMHLDSTATRSSSLRGIAFHLNQTANDAVIWVGADLFIESSWHGWKAFYTAWRRLRSALQLVRGIKIPKMDSGTASKRHSSGFQGIIHFCLEEVGTLTQIRRTNSVAILSLNSALADFTEMATAFSFWPMLTEQSSATLHFSIPRNTNLVFQWRSRCNSAWTHP